MEKTYGKILNIQHPKSFWNSGHKKTSVQTSLCTSLRTEVVIAKQSEQSHHFILYIGGDAGNRTPDTTDMSRML